MQSMKPDFHFGGFQLFEVQNVFFFFAVDIDWIARKIYLNMESTDESWTMYQFKTGTMRRISF